MQPDLNQIDFVVRDMEATLAFYRALGVEIRETAIWRRRPASATSTGARYAIVEDPDGNHVGLMSPSDPARRSAPPEI